MHLYYNSKQIDVTIVKKKKRTPKIYYNLTDPTVHLIRPKLH